ncbi:MAG: methylmalonyl Co-A mutase-associated GTPase MeaB [Gemmatimonadaceae bacterium]
MPPALPASLARLLGELTDRKPAALARSVSIVENQRAGADELLGALHSKLGGARRIGITGPPGAGKSTLTTQLTAYYRAAGLTVGVIAVDPTSAYTGGALLGDRIRMESVALDPGVFIRSMATRGALGGLASATRDVADVLDASGFDRVLIETVGVGQSELDVARTADTSIVVLVPESGDSIQTLKAGLMEIADIFVVNKSDRPGSDRLRNEIEVMIGMRGGHTMRKVPAHHGVDLKRLANPVRSARPAAQASDADSWTPPVLGTVAAKGEGTDTLASALDRHADYLVRSGELRARRRRRLRERVVEAVERQVRLRLWNDVRTTDWLESRLPDLEGGLVSPYAAANELLRVNGDLLTGADG